MKTASIEFDADVRLPAVLEAADGPTRERIVRNWSIVIRLDASRTVASLGPDIVPFPDTDTFSVDASALSALGFGPVNQLALTNWALSRTETPHCALFSVSTSLLMETAKLRAFSVLQPDVEMWAIGDRRSLSAEDPASNGIRTTLQAVAAVWGTAEYVCILPNNVSTAGFTDPEAARLAANIGRMMREESYISHLPDPTAGSILLDTAVSRLVDVAVRRQTELEATGAETMDALLAHPDVKDLGKRDRAWWTTVTTEARP